MCGYILYTTYSIINSYNSVLIEFLKCGSSYIVYYLTIKRFEKLFWMNVTYSIIINRDLANDRFSNVMIYQRKELHAKLEDRYKTYPLFINSLL